MSSSHYACTTLHLTHFQLHVVFLDEVGHCCCGRTTAAIVLINQYAFASLPTALCYHNRNKIMKLGFPIEYQ